MQTSRRLHYNSALDYAVQIANKKCVPLLIYGGIDETDPFLNPRTLQLYTSIWNDIKSEVDKAGVTAIINCCGDSYTDVLLDIIKEASLVVTDFYPITNIRNKTLIVSEQVDCAVVSVDSCGLIPLEITTKAPYSAFIFRKKVQQYFEYSLMQPPGKNPLENLNIIKAYEFTSKWKIGNDFSFDRLNNRHIKPVSFNVSRQKGIETLQNFVSNKLLQYETDRNHPDRNGVSNLSSFLSTGVLSVYDVIFEVLKLFPEWNVNFLNKANGKNRGFYGLPVAVESFFDELICWREIGFHYNYHSPHYDKIDDLPNWVQATLFNHSEDLRDYTYTYKELEDAQTHDPVWNAAQKQLVKEGRIHNYLRMLWGKKIIEWTSDYESALQYMIHLNNNYALDGRDPASYAGIFWCFGRFDRAWPERPVLGKLRYMSSQSTQKKIQLKKYLVRFRGKENN